MLNRVGYDFTAITFDDPSIPSWLKDALVSSQVRLDNQYKDALDNFFDNGASFLTTQSMIRGSQRDYQAPQFPIPIPRRHVAVLIDGTWTIDEKVLDPDPRIQLPTLDPLPPEQPSHPVFQTHPADTEILTAISRLSNNIVAVQQAIQNMQLQLMQAINTLQHAITTGNIVVTNQVKP